MHLSRWSPAVVLFVVSLPFSCVGHSQTTVAKAPTIDQSLEMHSVVHPKISPDGKRVLYEQTRTDWDADAFETDLWIADTRGERHLLTATGHSSSGAEWSPDGHWIAFLSDRPGTLPKSPEGKQQLYVMPADGGEAQQLTKMENGVSGFDWAPDSQRLAIAAEADSSKLMKDRKESFGDYHVIHADYHMTHLWLVDLPKTTEAGSISAPGDPKQLTKEDTFSVSDLRFSPDGKRIAFSATRDPDLISSFSADIYTVTVPDGAVKKIVDTPGPDTDPAWSPDGKQIAYVTSNGEKYFYYANQKIAVVNADGARLA
jgi:Tol biopolymer transport system component